MGVGDFAGEVGASGVATGALAGGVGWGDGTGSGDGVGPGDCTGSDGGTGVGSAAEAGPKPAIPSIPTASARAADRTKGCERHAEVLTNNPASRVSR